MIKITDDLNAIFDDLDNGTAIDPEAPMSSLAEWTKKFEEAFELEDDFLEQAEPILAEMLSSPEALLKVFVDVIERVSAELREKYTSNQEFASLLKLFTDVDAVQLNRAVQLIESCGVLGSQESILEGSSLIAQLEGIEGEKLAKKIITMTPTLIEDCYKRYLTCVISCKYALEGSSKLPSDKLGVMQQQAASLKNEYPLLIHPDIAWIRNALAHKNWKYNVATNKIKLFDNQNIEHEFSPEELVVEVSVPFNLSSQVFLDAGLYYKNQKILGATKKL